MERLLVILLRLGAALTLSAFLAVVMPTGWMAAVHAWLGLGTFPATPLVEYLTRTLAAFYGFHGGLLLVVSRDVRRYRGLVVYLGVMNVVFGAMLTAIDAYARLPLFWVLGEGPPLAACGVALLWLVRAVPGYNPPPFSRKHPGGST